MLFHLPLRIHSATTGIILLYIVINCVCLKVKLSHALGSSSRQDISPHRCELPPFKNGKLRWKMRRTAVKFDCFKGYELLGQRFIACSNGRWEAEFPVCAKRGCPKLDPPPNGFIDVELGRAAALFCKDTFQAAGNRKAFCDGENWDREIGTCRETFEKSQTSCDFETEDLCQWYHDYTKNFGWKRRTSFQANVINTGPKFDHTYQEALKGHYMLLETTDVDKPAHLISPLYAPEESINACFSLHYFMSGAEVGKLRVFIKPLSYSMDRILDDTRFIFFETTGNQRNLWHHETVEIDQFNESFQIVIEGSSEGAHLCDIAIDDVAIFQGTRCAKEEIQTTQKINETEESGIIYDYKSCKSRCEETQPPALVNQNISFKLIVNCACHPECEDSGTCCPDYRRLCAFGPEFSERTPTELNFYNTEKNNFDGTSPMLMLPSMDTFKSTESSASGYRPYSFTTNTGYQKMIFSDTSKLSTQFAFQTKSSGNHFNQILPKVSVETLTTSTSAIVVTRQIAKTKPSSSPTNMNVEVIFDQEQTTQLLEKSTNGRKILPDKAVAVLLQDSAATTKMFDIQILKTSMLENEAPDPAPLPILVVVLSLLSISAILAGAVVGVKYYYKNFTPDSYKKNVEIANRREQEEFSDVLYLTEQIDFTMQTQQNM